MVNASFDVRRLTFI